MKNWKVGDFAVLVNDRGERGPRARTWRVVAVLLGAVGQESIVELEATDRSTPGLGPIRVPADLLEVTEQFTPVQDGVGQVTGVRRPTETSSEQTAYAEARAAQYRAIQAQAANASTPTADALTALHHVEGVAQEVVREVAQARIKHAPMHSAHEAYAVIVEELDEFWAEVRAKVLDKPKARKELLQVAAMAIRAIVDLRL